LDIIYNKILSLINNKNVNKKNLSKFLGIAPSVISDWISGRSKSYIKYVDRIAEYFKVSTDYILKGEEEQKYDSPKSKTEKEFIVLARRTPNMSEKDHKEFIKFIEDSAETFFRLKGIIKDDEETDKDKKN
jgi:transcriptional regulator with XRE-family HTH domain